MLPDPERPARIVLYVDDTEDWHAGAKLVGDFARRTKSHVTVMSSLFMRGRRQRAMSKAQEILALPADRIDLVGKAGIIEYTIPRVVREVRADIVIISSFGTADQLTSGLIAHLVAKRTPASILIMRGRPRSIDKILVCTQGKRQGATSFECAAHVAKTLGSRLDVLHVVDKMGLTDTGIEELHDDLRDFLGSDAPEAEHLRGLDERLREKGIDGGIHIRKGLVVKEIIDAIHEGEFDILVIGAHDIGAPGASLYEDFASRILRASPVTTLVVRERPREQDN